MRLAIIGLAALLSGCVSQPISEMSYSEQKQFEAKIVQRCESQGYMRTSSQFGPCVKHEIDREFSIRENQQARANNAGQAFAAGISSYGNSLQQNAAAAQANAPRNCTVTPHSTFVGGAPSSYSTSCY